MNWFKFRCHHCQRTEITATACAAGPWSCPSCGPGFGFSVDDLPPVDFVRAVLEPEKECNCSMRQLNWGGCPKRWGDWCNSSEDARMLLQRGGKK